MVDKPLTGLRIAAIAAIVPLGLWGFLLGILPAIGCGLSDSPPTSGPATWYCSSGNDLWSWLYIAATTLLPIAGGVWARKRALRSRSWGTLLGGLVMAAASPLLFAYLIDGL